MPEREWERQLARDALWTPQFEAAQRGILQRQNEIVVQRLLKRGLRQRAPADELALALFPIEGWQQMFNVTVNPVRAGSFQQSADAATKAITEKAFVLTEAAREIVTEQNLAHYTFTNRTTQDLLVKVLDEGLRDGDSVQQMAKRISSDVFGVRKRGAKLIAQTEIAAAVSEAQTQGYKQTGVVERKQWNSSLDAAVRDSHLIDGQTVALDGDFELGDGDRGSAPADPKLAVRNRARCRCFLTPVFFDEDAASLGFPVAGNNAT